MAETQKRSFDNDTSELRKVPSPHTHLVTSLTTLVKKCPPQQPWASTFHNGPNRGFFFGPTSVAYLFFYLTKTHSTLLIDGARPQEWCERYLNLDQADVPFNPAKNGVAGEYLCYRALKAVSMQDPAYFDEFLKPLSEGEVDPSAIDWMGGRAGILYLLRFVSRWLPSCTERAEKAMQPIIAELMSTSWSPPGTKHKIRGAVHGDIGNLTQIVLSDPTQASKVEDKLIELLDEQLPSGHWLITPTWTVYQVQFCHGAPGFIPSLVAMRPHFPQLQARIDTAIEKGRGAIWREGLLTKEPSLCHGISGNALSLVGKQREHFMAYATPEEVDADGIWQREQDPNLRDQWGLLWGEAGRAWAWMVLDGGIEGFPTYSEV